MSKKVASGIVAACTAVATTVVGMTWPNLSQSISIPILASCGVGLLIAAILWFWPGNRPEENVSGHNTATARDGPALAGKFGDVHFHAPAPSPPPIQPAKSPYGSAHLRSPPTARVPRKVPAMTICQAADHIRAVTGDTDVQNCFPSTRIALRQAALNEEIEIWGRKENPPRHMTDESWRPVWTPIPADYWEDFDFTTFVTTDEYDREHTWNPDVPGLGRGNRYRDLKVDRAEIEGVWRLPDVLESVTPWQEKPEPDLPLAGLLVRVYRHFGGAPEAASEKAAFYRKVDLAIQDAFVLNELKVWGRKGDMPIGLLPPSLMKYARLNHRRGEIQLPTLDSRPTAYSDLKFHAAQVAGIWPDGGAAK